MPKKEFEKKLGKIIKLELDITEALSKGHKASDNDKFKKHREQLKKLRDELGLKRRAQ
jgi:hypothetical protein